MFKIHPLSRDELNQLIEQAKVIERDSFGPKVALLPNGDYIKYFRRKRFFNRELIAPAAIKFARNAHHLSKLGIPTMNIKSLHRIIGEPHTVAIYEPLLGRTVRDVLSVNEADAELMYRLGVFLARVQRRGIYFRSIHPGNIVVVGMGFGLIDILDMRFRVWSLNRWARRRNWRHLFRYPKEWSNRPDLVEAIISGYRHAADLPLRELGGVEQRVLGVLAK